MCFDHLHPPSPNSSHSPLTQLCVFFFLFFLWPTKDKVYCLNILGCMVFYQSIIGLPGPIILEKTDPSSPSSLQYYPRWKMECPAQCLHVGFQSALDLHRSCVWCCNQCEFTCTAALLFPEDTIYCHPLPLALTHFLPPLLQCSLSLWRRVCSVYSPLRVGHSVIPYALHRDVCCMYSEPNQASCIWGTCCPTELYF